MIIIKELHSQYHGTGRVFNLAHFSHMGWESNNLISLFLSQKSQTLPGNDVYFRLSTWSPCNCVRSLPNFFGLVPNLSLFKLKLSLSIYIYINGFSIKCFCAISTKLLSIKPVCVRPISIRPLPIKLICANCLLLRFDPFSLKCTTALIKYFSSWLYISEEGILNVVRPQRLYVHTINTHMITHDCSVIECADCIKSIYDFENELDYMILLCV